MVWILLIPQSSKTSIRISRRYGQWIHHVHQHLGGGPFIDAGWSQGKERSRYSRKGRYTGALSGSNERLPDPIKAEIVHYHKQSVPNNVFRRAHDCQ